MIILGLDPGFGTMGYGVIEKDARGNCRAVDYGVVKTPASENFAVRLCMLEQGVNALFDKFSPKRRRWRSFFLQERDDGHRRRTRARRHPDDVLQALRPHLRIYPQPDQTGAHGLRQGG